MRELIESIERRSLSEGISVGQTIENGDLRVHKYMGSIRVTDLSNAGKRGKLCDYFVLFDLDYAFRDRPMFEKELDKLEGFLAKIDNYEKALTAASNFVIKMEKEDKLAKGVIKGINVELGKNSIKGGSVNIEYSTTDFSISYDSKLVSMRAIPPINSPKKDIEKFFNWMSDDLVRARLKKMDFNQVLAAMNKKGIRYHTYDGNY